MNFETDSERHDALVRYLLDELGEEELDQVETSLLTDLRVREDLVAAEEELADRYVSRRLLPEQRELLRRKFGRWPEWNERLRLARAMSRAEAAVFGVDSGGTNGLRVWLAHFIGSHYRGTFIVAVSAAVFLAVWFAVGSWRNPFAERGTSGSRIVPAVASFLLTQAGGKGDQTQPENIVRLPGRIGPIELRLALNRDLYASYQVRLESADTGAQIQLGAAIPTRSNGVTEVRISVPSAILSAGRYTIVLRAAESDSTVSDVGGYSFRVIATHN